ncbi:hypothetical protein PPL_09704 [Heterostelium album PN500]|uniref:SHSP domain-containing protein n=1 Tax=Heterostelium pallidum (strain ATCC 26659 / Pp 5 / PN500) TaxID=670386 RepID=D3BNK1_HETP5|nr:hypothetical protein PPL_09704 [Heterostelium album PN500]EFA76952.1 hypothetical protein PPL_09704 [Heterostelium album PN500]|eukprot:XP_020429084.1 hypothetical protein PPL_09704 [Heterostelium album PN500]
MNQLVRPLSSISRSGRNLIAPTVRYYGTSNDQKNLKDIVKDKKKELKEPKKYDHHEFDDAMKSFKDTFFNNRLSKWFHEFEDMFPGIKEKAQSMPEALGSWGSEFRTPKTFWQKDDKAYSLKVEMPGLTKDDIKVNFENGKLVIESNKESESKEEGTWSKSSFYKSMSIPENIDHENISAKMENGQLLITMPCKNQSEKTDLPKKINIA